MKAIKIDANSKSIEYVDIDSIEKSISNSCEEYKSFLFFEFKDQSFSSIRFTLYADVNSNIIPFNTNILDFFTLNNIQIFQGNAIICGGGNNDFEDIFTGKLYSGGSILSYFQQEVKWLTMAQVCRHIFKNIFHTIESIQLEAQSGKNTIDKKFLDIEKLVSSENFNKQDLVSDLNLTKELYAEHLKKKINFIKRLKAEYSNYEFFDIQQQRENN
jgi:hypothetical protein